MATSLFGSIVTSWRKPGEVMDRLVDEGLSEARALMYLMLACLLFFVASTPGAIRHSQTIEAADADTISISAYFFAMMFVAPLIFYALAPVFRLLAKAVGGSGSFMGARTAFFWSLLQVALLAVPVSLAGVALELADVAGVDLVRGILGSAAFLLWIWWLSMNFSVVEKLRSPFGFMVPLAVVLFVVPVSVRWII